MIDPGEDMLGPSAAHEFSDNVMSAVAQMPAPTPTHTFFGAIRALAFRDALSALVVAWHLGTVRGWPIALRVRVRSVALVMAVVAMLGMGTLAAAAAVQVVVPLAVEPAPIVLPSTGDQDVVPAGPGHDPRPDPSDRSDEDSTVKAGTTGNDQPSRPKAKKGSAAEKDRDADDGEHDSGRDDESDMGDGQDHDAGPGGSGDGDEDADDDANEGGGDADSSGDDEPDPGDVDGEDGEDGDDGVDVNAE
jgi:hypothetical protein